MRRAYRRVAKSTIGAIREVCPCPWFGIETAADCT